MNGQNSKIKNSLQTALKKQPTSKVLVLQPYQEDILSRILKANNYSTQNIENKSINTQDYDNNKSKPKGIL